MTLYQVEVIRDGTPATVYNGRDQQAAKQTVNEWTARGFEVDLIEVELP